MKKVLLNEYAEKGEYHKVLDKSWKYYPVYQEKMRIVRGILSKVSKNSSIVDIGCGEGLIVKEFYKKGYTIRGIDNSYKSKYVERGNITSLLLHDNSVNVIICLDVLEHLSFEEQGLAVKEFLRVLKPGGKVILSVPNLAHIASRISFLFFGNLLRTSSIERHKGDRPFKEYLHLFKKNGFYVKSVRGIFPTLPLISILTVIIPGKVVWLHRLYNFFPFPAGWCFGNIIVFRKRTV